MSSAAFFDLDRTLISGASVFPFAVEAWRSGLVKNSELFRWGVSALSFKLLGDTGGDAVERGRKDFLGKIAGIEVERVVEVGRSMLPGLVNEVRPESKKLLRMHHDANRDTWIVSASPIGIVEGLADALGMTGAIGTKAVIVDGFFTDQLDGPFVYGPGKGRGHHEARRRARLRPHDVLCVQRLDQRSAHAGVRRTPGGRQPGWCARVDRLRTCMADCHLLPYPEAGHGGVFGDGVRCRRYGGGICGRAAPRAQCGWTGPLSE